MNGRQKVLSVLSLALLVGHLLLLTSCQLSGSTVMNPTKLAESVEPTPFFEPVLIWEEKRGGECYTVAIDSQGGAQWGACSGPLSPGQILSDMERPEDLHHFLNSFQPFEADTPAGRIKFSGYGTNSAQPSEQRAIAEWASIVYQELLYGRGGASWGMGMALIQEDGDSPCQEIQIEIYGKVMANDCRGGIHAYPRRWLTTKQLDRLYGWIDRLQTGELKFQGEDGQPVRFVFGGQGDRAATDVELKEMLGWVETIYGTVVR